jgi:hypothetical protein
VREMEREAYWQGYRDYTTSALLLNRQIVTGSKSPFSPVWRPSEGHEDAYGAGWETARLRALEERSRQTAA